MSVNGLNKKKNYSNIIIMVAVVVFASRLNQFIEQSTFGPSCSTLTEL